MPHSSTDPDPSSSRYILLGPDRALLAENQPAHQPGGGVAPATAGRLEFAKIRLPVPASVTNVVMAATVGGSVLTSGQCFAALYTEAKVRVGVTADQAANWASSGVKTMALASGPFACAAGNYYVAFFYNGTTSPTWLRGSSAGAAFINLGTAAETLMFGSADTGLTTTMPNPMGAQTARGDAWYVALS